MIVKFRSEGNTKQLFSEHVSPVCQYYINFKFLLSDYMTYILTNKLVNIYIYIQYIKTWLCNETLSLIKKHFIIDGEIVIRILFLYLIKTIS